MDWNETKRYLINLWQPLFDELGFQKVAEFDDLLCYRNDHCTIRFRHVEGYDPDIKLCENSKPGDRFSWKLALLSVVNLSPEDAAKLKYNLPDAEDLSWIRDRVQWKYRQTRLHLKAVLKGDFGFTRSVFENAFGAVFIDRATSPEPEKIIPPKDPVKAAMLSGIISDLAHPDA